MGLNDWQDRLRSCAEGAVVDIGPGEFHVNVVVDRAVTLRGRGASTHLMGVPGSGPALRITSPGVVVADVGVEHLDAEGVAIQADPAAAPRLMNVRVTGGRLVGIDDRCFVTTPAPVPAVPQRSPAPPVFVEAAAVEAAPIPVLQPAAPMAAQTAPSPVIHVPVWPQTPIAHGGAAPPQPSGHASAPPRQGYAMAAVAGVVLLAGAVALGRMSAPTSAPSPREHTAAPPVVAALVPPPPPRPPPVVETPPPPPLPLTAETTRPVPLPPAWGMGVRPVSVAASSEFHHRREHHPAEHAFDGNIDTAWNSESGRDPRGQWLEARFAGPVRLTGFRLVPGFLHTTRSGQDLFTANSQIRTVYLVAGGREVGRWEVPRGQQELFVSGLDVIATSARFRVADVWLGAEFQEVCVSEVTFTSE